MSKLKNFSIATARMMPVIILADISGSMTTHGKLTTLNQAIAEMIANFADEQDCRAEIYVAVVTFGGNGANLHLPLQPASQVQWTDMEAKGPTPMGKAFEIATELLEDKATIPTRSYNPNLVLVSDGQPTDERGHISDNWKEPLQRLLDSERASKAVRFAMGIGPDADETTLQAFVASQNPDIAVFRADETGIQKFFRWVTISVTSRSRSINPNNFPPPDFNIDDLLEF